MNVGEAVAYRGEVWTIIYSVPGYFEIQAIDGSRRTEVVERSEVSYPGEIPSEDEWELE